MTDNTMAGKAAVISLKELHIEGSLKLPVDLVCELEKGQLLVLTGGSGTGKSTTLSVLAGRTPMIDRRENVVPIGLSIIAEGEPVTGLSGAPLNGQYVPQDLLEFWIGAKVFSEVELAHQLHTADESAAAGYRRERLAAFSINSKTYDRICELSAGEQTTVALCSALASAPRILLLDEPFCVLCESNRSRVIDMLSRYLEDDGIIVLATHSPERVMSEFARFGPKLHVLPGGDTFVFSENAGEAIDCVEGTDCNAAIREDDAVLYQLPGTDVLTEDDVFLFSTANLVIHCGDSIRLEGANGSGKTTFLRYLGGSRGRWPEHAHFCGDNVGGERPAYPDDVGFVAQIPLLQAFRGTVEDYILFTARFSRASKTTIEGRFEQIRPLLSVFQIGLEELVVNLSYGQRKLIALCRYLNCPKLLLLDEVPYFVDMAQQQAVKELLCLFLANGTSLVFTSHHPVFPHAIANRAFRIDNGWLNELSQFPSAIVEETA